MLSISKKNNSVFTMFASRNFLSGKTVTMTVYDDSNSVLAGSPFTLSEIGSSGMYGTSFIPTTNGEYKVKVFEDSVSKAVANIKIADYDIVSVGGDVTTIKTILVHATYGNEALQVLLDNIDTSAEMTAKLNNIKVKDNGSSGYDADLHSLEAISKKITSFDSLNSGYIGIWLLGIISFGLKLIV